MTGKFDNMDMLDETSQIYGIDIKAKRYFIVCVHLGRMEQDIVGVSRTLLAVDNIFKSIAQQYNYQYCSYINTQNRIVALFCCPEIGDDEKSALVNELQSDAEHFTKTMLFVGVGNITDDIGKVKSSYYGAMQALNYKSFFNDGAGVADSRDTSLKDNSWEYYSSNDIEDIFAAYQSGDIDTAIDRVCKILDGMAGKAPKAFAKNFALEFIATLRRDVSDARLIADCESELLQKNTDTLEIDELGDILRKLIAGLNEKRMNSYKQQFSKKIRMAKEFINANYTNPSLGLRDAAEHVGLSNAYFCSLFHSQLGIRFSEYLVYIRIENAKELLREGIVKIYEIAFLVGFNDSKYFSSKFKTLVGVSPSEYRENNRET